MVLSNYNISVGEFQEVTLDEIEQQIFE
jgi:hypothetical protein